MDFTILYRVIWKPSEVFNQFKSKLRIEPFILVAVISIISGINAYLGPYKEVNSQPLLFVLGVVEGFFILLLPSVTDAVIIFLIAFLIFKERTSFLMLVSAFALCELPYYFERILVMAFNYPSIGLGSLITVFGDIQPFVFGMVATITPFFVWNLILWWAAIKEILNFKLRQNILLVGSLVLTSMLLNGLWYQVKCTWLK